MNMVLDRVLTTVFLVTVIILLLAPNHVDTNHTCSNTLEGQIRVVDGPNSREGRVDMCVSGYWYTPCTDSWGTNEARVVCRELGLCTQGGTIVSGEAYQRGYPWDLLMVNCLGNETALINCSRPSSYCYSYRQGAGVNCSTEDAPGLPADVEITILDHDYQIQVSWSPPDMSNCTDVEEYRVTCFNWGDIVTEWTSSTQITLGPLNSSYFNDYYSFHCCVSGNNSVGLGPQHCVLPRPTPPRNVSATPIPSSLTSLLVEWVEPKHINGRFYAYWVVCGMINTFSFNITWTTLEVTGLSVFTTHTCCVSVYTDNFPFISFSAQHCANATTWLEPPFAPVDVTVTEVTTNTVQLEWTTPHYNGTLSHYIVACTQTYDQALVWHNYTSVNATSENVTGLQPFADYTCCVSASNQAGEGNQTCVSTKTLSVPPTKPEDIVIISSDYKSLTLTWREPVESYGGVLFYDISCSQLQDLNPVQFNTSANTLRKNVTNLQPFTNYTCCVSASNQAGQGNHSCIIARTQPAPPTKPENAEIISTDSRSLTLTWREPVESYGGILFYTISCSQLQDLNPVQINTSANTLRETVTNLQPFTNYTCCVSASNQAGQGNQSCVTARTQPAPPTEPEGITTVYNDIDNLTLAWREPAESYGQDILFYSISCTSLSNHTITIESVLQMSAHVTGVNSNTDYTCCVSAVSSVGPGNSVCISVSIVAQTQMNKQSSLDVAAAVSGGVLLALLAILFVVITVIACRCFKKTHNRSQQRPKTGEISVEEKDSDFNKSIIINTQADDVLYRPDYKEEVEIRYERPNTSSSAQSGRMPNRQDYKEEVEIRYERPVLQSRTKAESKLEQDSEQTMSQKPCSQEEQRNVSTSTQYDKQDTERIYQPLIPPKTYMEPAVSSAYQDLTFETREPRSEADGSEGQYETVRRPEETNQYEPLTFGVSTPPQTDGGYQALTKRDEGSHYQDLHSVRT